MNALARAYIEQNMEFKFLTSKEATDWLSARMAEARTQVEDAEVALQKYRAQNEAISLEDRENIVVQKRPRQHLHPAAEGRAGEPAAAAGRAGRKAWGSAP